MKETYSLIFDMNRDLMMEHAKRVPNHKIASESREEITKEVFKFATLRGQKGLQLSGSGSLNNSSYFSGPTPFSAHHSLPKSAVFLKTK